jgi:hypothetical protein
MPKTNAIRYQPDSADLQLKSLYGYISTDNYTCFRHGNYIKNKLC